MARRMPWDSLQAEVATDDGQTESLSPLEWSLFRGDATRTAEGRGSAPFLEANWRHSMVGERIDPATRTHVEAALRLQHTRADAFLPAFFPIATGGKLVFRTYKGLTAVDIKTGELLWHSTDNFGGLDVLLHDSNMKQQVEEWYGLYSDGNNTGNIIFENSTIGTLSTDNVRVYAVDDLGIPPHPGGQGMQQFGGGGGTPLTGKLLNLTQHNRLVAIELDSGKTRLGMRR